MLVASTVLVVVTVDVVATLEVAVAVIEAVVIGVLHRGVSLVIITRKT